MIGYFWSCFRVLRGGSYLHWAQGVIEGKTLSWGWLGNPLVMMMMVAMMIKNGVGNVVLLWSCSGLADCHSTWLGEEPLTELIIFLC